MAGRMSYASAIFFGFALIIEAAEDKWVWNSNGRQSDSLNSREYNVAISSSAEKNRHLFQATNHYRDEPFDREGRPRYEVQEPDGDPAQHLPPFRPQPNPPRPPIIIPPDRRPDGFPPRPPPPPPPPLPPPPPPPPNNYRPERPPIDSKPGILTGPIPSWEQTPNKNIDPTRFDQCKCVHAFNCKSPGLKFASCDVGKTYCCYNSQRYGLHKLGQPGNFGSKFGPDDNTPAVLAGPNGPVDHLRPDYYKPPPIQFRIHPSNSREDGYGIVFENVIQTINKDRPPPRPDFYDRP